MAVTSVPKAKLVDLIVNTLDASLQAAVFFRIKEGTVVGERLLSFSKDELLTFITHLGAEAEKALKELETHFPLRRSPTLYISIIDSLPDQKNIFTISNQLSELGRKTGMHFESKSPVRFVYLPQGSVRTFSIQKTPIVEFQLHYEHRLEYFQSNPEADNYSELTEIYSLETAFVWIPLEKHSHAVITCCDYPAVRRIRDFLRVKLDVELRPPWLDKEMLEKITHGSYPRTLSYSLLPTISETEEIQHITISDPNILEKRINFLTENPNREQTSGFYMAHPGLSRLGGLGVARRDGKIWTPRKLKYSQLADLSIAIIDQVEKELAKTEDYAALIKYFFGRQTKLGKRELKGGAKDAWLQLAALAIETQRSKSKDKNIPVKLLNNLLIHQKELKLLVSVEFDCSECGITYLAKCPKCQGILNIKYNSRIVLDCEKCGEINLGVFTCDCGAEQEINDLEHYIRILPEKELNKSIENAAQKSNIKYSGIWGIRGLSFTHIERPTKFTRLHLKDLQLWKNQGRIDQARAASLSVEKIVEILKRTKEKCMRDGTRSSEVKCSKCKNEAIDPKWILRGDTCLLRLFGVPIGKKFDGVHHGHELADLIYEDILLSTNDRLNIGIHVKSRYYRCPKLGLGRTSEPIMGLFKQVVFSAFEAAVKGKNLQVLGIAVPNKVNEEVLDSLAYAVNMLGFWFIVVEEDDWLKIISNAYEQAFFS